MRGNFRGVCPLILALPRPFAAGIRETGGGALGTLVPGRYHISPAALPPTSPGGVQDWWLNRAAERLMARRISPRMGKPATLRRFYSCCGVIRTETCVKNLSPVRRSAEPFSNDAVKTKLKPSEAGSTWRGGARECAEFCCGKMKRNGLCDDESRAL